jgi:hypothetical protein
LLLHYRSNNLEGPFNAFDVKRSPRIDVIDSYAPTARIAEVVQADLFPESENEPLIVGGQRYSSSDPRTSVSGCADAGLSRKIYVLWIDACAKRTQELCRRSNIL